MMQSEWFLQRALDVEARLERERKPLTSLPYMRGRLEDLRDRMLAAAAALESEGR